MVHSRVVFLATVSKASGAPADALEVRLTSDSKTDFNAATLVVRSLVCEVQGDRLGRGRRPSWPRQLWRDLRRA